MKNIGNLKIESKMLPRPNTPIYNHSLPEIEEWLQKAGCQRDPDNLHYWNIDYLSDEFSWKARIILDTQEIVVSYLGAGVNGADINRSFKYSLSRKDIEEAIFSGP